MRGDDGINVIQSDAGNDKLYGGKVMIPLTAALVTIGFMEEKVMTL